MGEDYYALLGVEVNASPAQIKKAYREKAKVMHPDKCHAPNAHQKFIQLKKAYDCLSNEDERRKYNLTRPAPRHPNHQYGQPGPSHYSATQHAPNGPFTWTFKRQEKTTPKMSKSEEWKQREADGIFTDFMNRMRRQREEEMRRRHEAFSQEQHQRNNQADIDASKKMARLKLFWPVNVIYTINDLKERLNAQFIFSAPAATKNAATIAFKTAQEALTASQLLEEEFRNIEFYWLTPKPCFDAKTTIHIDSDESDIELVEDDDDIEFVEENAAPPPPYYQNAPPTQEEELIILDSDDETQQEHQEPTDDNFEVIEGEEEDVHMISDSDLSDTDEEAENQATPPPENGGPIEISDSESEDYIVTSSMNEGRTTPIVIL